MRSAVRAADSIESETVKIVALAPSKCVKSVGPGSQPPTYYPLSLIITQLRKLPHEHPVVAILKHEHHLSEVETTENNMMLAGIPPRAGGASGRRLGARAFSVNGLQNSGRGVR